MNQEKAQEILEQTKAGYDQIAVNWDRTRQYLWPGSDEFFKYVKTGDKVLDAGCGNGRLIKLLGNVNVSYTGVDSSSELIKIAKNNFPTGNFIVGDILKLPFTDNYFDVVFCWATLHHLPGKKLRHQAILEMGRVLKPHSFLIMLNWHYGSPTMVAHLTKFTLAKIIGKSELDFGDVYLDFNNQGIKRYIHLFTRIGLERLIQLAGFEVVKNYLSPPTKRGFRNIVTVAKKC